LSLWLIVTACSGVFPGATTTSTAPPTTTTAEVITTTTARDCEVEPAESTFLEDDPVQLSVLLTQAAFACADQVVVAAGNNETLLAAAQLASAVNGPLLIIDDVQDAAAELTRLQPLHVFVVGDVLPVGIPAGTTTTSLSTREAFGEASSRLGGIPILTGSTFRPLGRIVTETLSGSTVVRGPTAEASAEDVAWTISNDSESDRAWLVPFDRPDLVAPALAVAGIRDESLFLVDRASLLGNDDLVTAIRSVTDREVVAAGDFGADLLSWQLAALQSAPQLPGGGLTFGNRRLVALYGNPTTSALGVLGEQGPEEAVQRAAEIALGYDADGVPVVLSFEIIATVASAFAGDDVNYSEEMPLDVLRPWIEEADAAGVYVLLDLQPGRTDFLTQAKAYEEFLRLPHVGLALDPEWRLDPDQVHLRQIGSVDAAEVNQVSEWLAGVVRENALPQKLFLLHQFRLDMIENRDQLLTRPELATVIQMDGQGPLHTKYETWSALTAGTENLGVSWGWKNFYDEDTPRGGATPAEVLALDPVPVYVSYQ
jgi:hypothetical protein